MEPDADVRYGDYFCFYNAQTDSVLNVEGFCEDSAYPLEYERVQKAILDWSGSLFVIEPKSSFSSRQEFLSFVSDNVVALFDSSSAVDGFPSEMQEEALNRKAQMIQRVSFELDTASSNYDQHYGKAVKYGDVVQLRHVNSGRYLSSKSSGLDGCTQFAVVDSSHAVESSHWRFHSSSRKFGNLKYAVDSQLSSVVYDALMAVTVGPTGPTSYNMCSQVDVLSTFKLVYLGQDKCGAKCLCTGDAINISHFTSTKMLTSRYGDFLTFQNVESQSSALVQDSFAAPARACFVVEGGNVFEPIRSKVTSAAPLRIRCVCTGEIMALASHVGPEIESSDIFSDDFVKPMIACTVQASPTIVQDTTFHLPGIDDHDEMADSCFQIVHAESTMELAIISKNGQSILAPNYAESGHNVYFRCATADPVVVLECRRLASYKSAFEYLVALIGLEVSINSEFVSAATHHFEDLERWLTDAPPRLRLWRQEGLHDNGCVDLLRTLLGAPMEICKMPLSAIVKQQRYRHVCSFISSCGRCIEAVVTSCPLNGSRFLSWIESLIEVMMCFESVAKVILACFVCSIGATRMVKMQHIHAIIDVSKGQSRSRFYQSLSQLLLRDGEDSIRFQDFLLCKFFPSSSDLEISGGNREVIPVVRAEGKKVVVLDITPDRLPQSLDVVINSPALFSSLCAILDLADALCHNHCTRAVKELLAIDIVPYKVGLIILNDFDLPYAVRTRVLKVMHRLYILATNSKNQDCSKYELLIPWSSNEGVARYSVSNVFPEHASWENTIELQDVVLRTIESNDCLGFNVDKDAFTAAAVSMAISFCRIGTFCMPIEHVVKASGPYFQARAQAFLTSKHAERGKALGVSSDSTAFSRVLNTQFLQLELLLQPLQMLLDTSTDNIKTSSPQEAMYCKAEAMRCISIILGIRRHIQILQTLKRFSEDIAASKVSKNVDMLEFTPSAIAVVPPAMQLVSVNMATLPATLTDLFCYPQNSNRIGTIELIVTLFLDNVHFLQSALSVLLLSDPLIVASYHAIKDFVKIMEEQFKRTIVLLPPTPLPANGGEIMDVQSSEHVDSLQAADFALMLSQYSDLVSRPILSCSSPEIIAKIHLVSQELGLPEAIMSGLNQILSLCAPITVHEASQLTPRMRKSTPRPINGSVKFSAFHKKLVNVLCDLIVRICPQNPRVQKFFFGHIDSFTKLLQLYGQERDCVLIFDAISAILSDNRDICIMSQDCLISELIILLIRKGKWATTLSILRTCLTFVESPALFLIQKPIMLGLVRNFVILVQLPFSDSAMFSDRSRNVRESSVAYTIQCMHLLCYLCKDNSQNQSTVRGWVPIGDVSSVLKCNLKNHDLASKYIELIAAAYMVPSFDMVGERASFLEILGVLNDIISIFCTSNSVKVHMGTTSPGVQLVFPQNDDGPGATATTVPPSLVNSVVLFYFAMYSSHQPVQHFSSPAQVASSLMISILCERSCPSTLRDPIKRLLDHFFASRLLPDSLNQLYGSLPSQFETNAASGAIFAKPDDSAASLWPYFLNQEYGMYTKDVDTCVAQLVKHFEDAVFLNPNLDIESRLMWSIQQSTLTDATRTVLIKVAHSMWKTSSKPWRVSTLRVFFAILCDLFIAYKHSEKPSDVCFASIAFCTDLLMSAGSSNIYQGEFFDVMKSYGNLCLASIQCILDSAVYNCEEYARRLSSSKERYSSVSPPMATSDSQDEIFLMFCQKLFVLLKSFCEGHFSDAQTLLGQSLGSLNVINLSAQVLCAIASAQSELAHLLQLSALDFLVESLQGPCLHNCEVALNSRIATAFNTYTRIEPYSFEYPVMPSDISMARFEKFFVFLQALLEETRSDARNKPLFHAASAFILANADFSRIQSFLENACSLLVDSRTSAKTSRLRNLCSSIFVLLTYLGASSRNRPVVLEPFCPGFYLKDNHGRSKAAIAKWEKFIAEYWSGIVSIEISRDRALFQVFFFSRATPSRLQEIERVDASLDFSIEHPQGRLVSFLKNIDQMHYELKHISHIATRPFLALLMSMHNFFYYGRYVSVVFVNLLIFLSYQYKPKGFVDDTGELDVLAPPSAIVDVARGPCVYFIFICYTYLLFHLSIIDGLPIIRSKLRSHLNIDSEQLRWVLFQDCSLSLGLDLKGPFHIIQCIFALFGHTRFFVLSFCFLLCLYLVSDNQNWFSTIATAPLLLELISTSSLVQLAIGSVTRRWRLLCQVSIATLMFVYWCSCVIFVFFYNDLEFSVSRVVDGESPPPNENEYFVAPRHLWKCFVFVLDNSLRTQDIGKAFGIVPSSKYDEVLLNMPIARVFIRITISFVFWFVFQLIFLRVFPGVISDTFKDNRIKDFRARTLRFTQCFVCGLESHVFALSGSSFERHIRKEHAPYNYMRYFIYLAEKDPNEYTGLESFVVKCILAFNVEFLPAGTCLSFQPSVNANAQKGDTDDISKTIESRLNLLSQQQRDVAGDLDRYMVVQKEQALRFGIVDIREDHRKRMEILKLHPFISP